PIIPGLSSFFCGGLNGYLQDWSGAPDYALHVDALSSMVGLKVEVETERVVVTIDKRAHNPYLVASGLADKPASMPWFGNKQLHIRFA
ncbi:MAG: hypothetical protein AAB225_19060, partial [Acidobacteriota bacterium]